jgi:hypothetical protein
MSAFVIVKSHLAALDTVAFNSFLSLSLSNRLDAVWAADDIPCVAHEGRASCTVLTTPEGVLVSRRAGR